MSCIKLTFTDLKISFFFNLASKTWFHFIMFGNMGKHLSSVNIFPNNFLTNVLSCLLQLKPKAFLWMWAVHFIFQVPPNLHGVPDFDGASSSSSGIRQLEELLCFDWQFSKNNWNLLHMPRVLTILTYSVKCFTFLIENSILFQTSTQRCYIWQFYWKYCQSLRAIY